MRVFYVCTGNSFRSPSAEALTRRFRPGIEVESGGTDPAYRVAPVAKELLDQENALQYVKPNPERVKQRAIDDASLVVAMMPEHKDYLLNRFDVSDEEVVVWNIEDPLESRIGAAEVFERIKHEVQELG